MTGVVKSVSIWLNTRPPTIAIPSGRRSSEPVPVPSASGNPPNNAAIVVIVIGRKRRRQARKMASSGGTPCVRSTSSAKSIIRMAFFFTMPMSRMMPISAITVRSVRLTMSASRAPTPADGIVERIVIGWMQLS